MVEEVPQVLAPSLYGWMSITNGFPELITSTSRCENYPSNLYSNFQFKSIEFRTSILNQKILQLTNNFFFLVCECDREQLKQMTVVTVDLVLGYTKHLYTVRIQ